MADNKVVVQCPACGNDMTKIFVNEAKCNVDICLDGCGGIWFDNQELKKMDEKHENIDEILEVIKGKSFIEVSDNRRICPICGTPMVKNFVSVRHEIQIDECYNCGGKFLDKGELTAMRNQYANDAEREAAVLEMSKAMCSSSFCQQEESSAYSSTFLPLFQKLTRWL